MHIVVNSFSGNTGKSTISDNLLAPRMNNAKVIRIESINAHEGDSDENMTGKQYGDLAEGIVIFDNAVVDVGSSNVEDFHRLMQQYRGSHELWDYFVVPTVPSAKQIRDTIATIDSLASAGVPAEKIRLVFNKVESEDDDLRKKFSPIFAYYEAEKTFTLNADAVIYDHEFFKRSRESGKTIEDIINDNTDYAALIKAATEPEEKVQHSRNRALKWLAIELNEKLDKAFKALFE